MNELEALTILVADIEKDKINLNPNCQKSFKNALKQVKGNKHLYRKICEAKKLANRIAQYEQFERSIFENTKSNIDIELENIFESLEDSCVMIS